MATRKLNNIQQTLEISDLDTNDEPFQCSICFVRYERGKGIKLRSCSHIFCQPCIIYKVKSSRGPSIQCPYFDVKTVCKRTLRVNKIIMNYTFLVYNLIYFFSKEFEVQSISKMSYPSKTQNKQQQTNILNIKPKEDYWKTRLVNDNLNITSDKMKNKYKKKLESNQEPFRCTACFVSINTNEGVKLTTCSHLFCKLCLTERIIENINEPKIRCRYFDSKDQCKEFLKVSFFVSTFLHTLDLEDLILFF